MIGLGTVRPSALAALGLITLPTSGRDVAREGRKKAGDPLPDALTDADLRNWGRSLRPAGPGRRGSSHRSVAAPRSLVAHELRRLLGPMEGGKPWHSKYAASSINVRSSARGLSLWRTAVKCQRWEEGAPESGQSRLQGQPAKKSATSLANSAGLFRARRLSVARAVCGPRHRDR